MCAVVPILIAGLVASTVASIGGSVMSYMGQQATASAQKRAQEQAYEANRQSALASDRSQQKQLTLRTIQEQDQNSQQNRMGALNVARQAAKTELSAAESNVTGVSLDNLVADLYRQEDNNQTARSSSYDNTVAQIAAQREAVGTATYGRISNYSLSPVNGASVGGLVAGIGGSLGSAAMRGASIYDYLQEAKPSMQKAKP